MLELGWSSQHFLFIICLLFTVIILAQFQFLFTRSVYLFPGSSLRHSLFCCSSPFLVVANLAHLFAIQLFQLVMLESGRSLLPQFFVGNFPILVHNLFGMYNCFSNLRYFDMLMFHKFSLCHLKFYCYLFFRNRYPSTFRYPATSRYHFYYIQARFEDTFLPLA